MGARRGDQANRKGSKIHMESEQVESQLPASAPVSPAQPEPVPASPVPARAGAGLSAGATAEPAPAVAALDRTGPIRGLDATESEQEGQAGAGVLIGAVVFAAVLVVLFVVLVISGTLRL